MTLKTHKVLIVVKIRVCVNILKLFLGLLFGNTNNKWTHKEPQWFDKEGTALYFGPNISSARRCARGREVLRLSKSLPPDSVSTLSELCRFLDHRPVICKFPQWPSEIFMS